MEVSGLEWYGDTLFFLDQIPSAHDNKIFFSTRNEINNAIAWDDSLLLHDFGFIQEGITGKIGKIADYEGIAFHGDSLYLLIEVEEPMRSFIVKGRINKNAIIVDENTLTGIPLRHNIPEIACETLLIYNNKVLVFYEANGANIESNPAVFCFDLNLKRLESLDFENVEYRITDATEILKDNSFWVLNRLWPGEMQLLKPAREKLIPSTYDSNADGVNRLIQMEIVGNKIRVKNDHPLMLPPKDWNWEGLAAFDETSFLIINDEFSAKPYRTELRYIKMLLNE